MSIADLVTTMREQADWLERNAGPIPEESAITNQLAVHLYASGLTLEGQQKLLRALGSFRKNRSGDTLWVTHTALQGRQNAETILFLKSRSFCTRTERTVTLPAQEALPEREKTVVEWDCPDSLLRHRSEDVLPPSGVIGPEDGGTC